MPISYLSGPAVAHTWSGSPCAGSEEFEELRDCLLRPSLEKGVVVGQKEMRVEMEKKVKRGNTFVCPPDPHSVCLSCFSSFSLSFSSNSSLVTFYMISRCFSSSGHKRQKSMVTGRHFCLCFFFPCVSPMNGTTEEICSAPSLLLVPESAPDPRNPPSL